MERPRTPAEAISYLSSLGPSVGGDGNRTGLDRTRIALEALGHPEKGLPVVHVAGTNGKGSTCAFAASCLQALGKRVGLFTSPHLHRINERIAVNGRDISDQVLGRRILEVLERFPTGFDPSLPRLTFFDFFTVLALWHFRQEALDVAVLETGLGGRLDPTSAAEPRVTAVTPISLDHTELLGDTVAAIAAEKAGIFRKHVPAVVSRQVPAALEVLETHAKDAGSRLYLEGRDFGLTHVGSKLRYQGRQLQLDGIHLPLAGEHQLQNAAMALACIEQLEFRTLNAEALRQGLGTTRWPGRLEEIGRAPMFLLDGAHNPGATVVLREALETLYGGRRIHLVFGALADKAWPEMIRTLFPRCASVQIAPVPSPRAIPPDALVRGAGELGIAARAHSTLQDALAAAMGLAGPSDLILCTGSLILVAEARMAIFAKISLRETV